MTSAEVAELSAAWEMGVYQRYPVAFTGGCGVYLSDGQGKSYLDLFAGVAVSQLGYSHPRLTAAVRDGAGLLHLSNHYHCVERALLARRLGELSSGMRVFFVNSGTEAVEAAIKLIRKWGGERRRIITTLGSFHGRTLGALAATGQSKYQRDFEPLPGGFAHVPFDDLTATEEAVDEHTAAVMVEPIQGEGGIHPASLAYLRGLRQLADQRGILLVFDEVQCGLGRTGSLFAYQEYDVEPDIVVLAKGLGGGVPIGAVLAKPDVAAAFVPGDHGSTFGGNPLSCRAALAVLAAIEEEDILERVRRVGRFLREGLQKLAAGCPAIREIRGMGLMIGAELAFPARPVAEACLRHGLLVGVSDRTLRFEPPLILTEEEAEHGLAILGEVLGEMS